MRHRRQYGQNVLEDLFEDWLIEQLGETKKRETKKKDTPKGRGLTFSEGVVVAIIMQPIVGAVTKAIMIHLGVQ